MARIEIDAKTWARLNELLDEALEQPPSTRESWMAALDPQFANLMPQLRDLLSRSHAIETDDFLRTLPQVDVGALPPAETVPLGSAGEIVGAYRLVREIGSGGMGSVWLAERADGLMQRRVALKLPHLIAPRREELAARMARERELLAQLEHPNIAALYDAGITAQGRPFLALEYVEGKPIDAYCRELQLDTQARLRLFIQVAAAVAHAHAKLIVHRDLKPSNILVTVESSVRLLDFGIAKLLESGAPSGTPLTEFSGPALTPDYASPEQILGTPLTVASDVYSLGIVLFELLTDQRPYRLARASRGALEDAVLQIEPRKPSDLAESARRAGLRGDLDTIVLKALKKRPEERYATVNALLVDIERHLANQPILAHPDSRAYVLRKFVRRNRVAAAAGGAVLLAIFAGTGIALWQAREARAQRNLALSQERRANEQAEAARESERIARAESQLNDYLTADLALGRSASDIESQIERAIAFVRLQHRDDPKVRLQLLAKLAARFRQTANNRRFMELNAEIESAAAALGEQDVLARVHCSHARDLSIDGRIAEARALMGPEISKLRQRKAPIELLTLCLALASSIERSAGNAAGALAGIEEVAHIEESAGLGKTEMHAGTQFLLSRAYSQLGRYQDAEAAAQKSARIHQEGGYGDSPGMSNTQIIHGRIAREGGRPDRALAIFEAVLSNNLARGGDPAAMHVQASEKGLALLDLGEADAAAKLLRSALVDARQRKDSGTERMIVASLVLALVETARNAEARRTLTEAAGSFAAPRKEAQYAARKILFASAAVALAEHDTHACNAALLEARAILEKLDNPADPAWREYREWTARLSLAQGHYADARDLATAALEQARRQALDPAASVFAADAGALEAEALAKLGDWSKARDTARQALAQYRAVSATKKSGYRVVAEIAGLVSVSVESAPRPN